MKKPFYKHWIFWAAVIVAGGIIGLTAGNDGTTDHNSSTVNEEAQPVAEGPSAMPTAEPATASAETAASSPSPETIETTKPSISWESAVKQIAGSETASAQKADAVEILARDYQPSDEEMKDFQAQIIEEFTAQNYLSQIEDAEYMLTNIFKAVVVEHANEGTPIGDFATDFYQNSKYTFRGEDAPDSDAVKSNEEQMQKALNQIQ
jgi:hypothetical protein